VLEGTPDFTFPNQELPILADSTGAMSFQTIDDPNANGDTALVGAVPGDSVAPAVKFFCGDAADQCSVDVDDWSLLPPGSKNIAIPVPTDTAVIPLGYAPQSTGCPKATFDPTYSDNSITELIQHESPVVCAGKSPVIPLNTPTSTSTVLPFLTSGDVLFVDDPEAADVQAALAKVHYAVVPIVASAVVMGYVAAMQQGGQKYPFNGFELTPNEAAGLSVYNYQGSYDGDMVKCGAKGKKKCSAIQGLNTLPGFVGAGQYGVFPPSETSSVTEELTNWMCNAPNVPFMLNGTLVTDPNSAQNTLTHAGDNGQKPWPITSCTAFDTFPAFTPLGILFDPAADPLHAVKFLRTFAAPPQFESSPVAGFAPMDWGDARYNGLDSASLQNAEGQFVAPSAASVSAQVAAETVSPGGYPLPDPTLQVNGGYPMSTVIDALVPDSTLPAAQATPIAEMMDELLGYTTTTSQLPDGYARLPSKLAALAHTELANVLAAENAGRTSPTTTTASVEPAAVSVGASVTFSANVTAPSGIPAGTVTFTTGSKPICQAVLSAGKASCSSAKAPVGIDTVTASYPGTPGFAASTATTVLTVTTSQPPPSTVPTTTIPATVATGGGGTTPPKSVPTSVVTRTTAPPKSKKPATGSLSIADVTLSAAAARVVLPIALIVGGSLIALSLGLSFVGYLRRRQPGGAESG